MQDDQQLRRGSGEEQIDEEGRNPTQQQMDEEGPDPRPVDAEQAGNGEQEGISAADEEIGDVIVD